jgi:hypothetical protein
VPGGVAKTFIPMRELVMQNVFDEWLARGICFAFSISPSAFTSQVNRATAETAQETSLSEGLVPLQNWVKQLSDQVIATEFAAPDLEFAWADECAINPGMSRRSRPPMLPPASRASTRCARNWTYRRCKGAICRWGRSPQASTVHDAARVFAGQEF